MIQEQYTMTTAVNSAAGLSRYIVSPAIACAVEDLNYERDELELDLMLLAPDRDDDADMLNERILELNEVEAKLLAGNELAARAIGGE